MLRLELLGSPQIARDGCPLTGFVSTKAQALLYYLAITGRPHSRAALAGLLWGELPEVDARMNLRHVLSNLRQLVGAHLQITRETVAFDRTAPYWLDVEHVQAGLQQPAIASTEDIGQLRAAIALYQGDLLEGFYVRVAPDFEEWLTVERDRLRLLMLYGIHQLCTQLMSRGNYGAALDAMTRLLALDPLQEDTHRQLMLLLAQSGQYDAALLQYQSCVRVLANELGVEPAIETTALFEQIRREALASAAARPAHLPTRPVTQRRHLTLLACQVSGLLTLAEQLDPDDFGEHMQACNQIFTDVAETFGGQVVEYRSDGILIAFGYTQPHDHDPLTAVRAGLVLVDAFQQFASPFVAQGSLSVQAGVHTGLVTVGERTLQHTSSLAIMGLPLIAVNRLQAIAEPSTLLISASVERFVRDEMPCVAYGTHVFYELKQPLVIFQVRLSDAYIELPQAIPKLKPVAQQDRDGAMLTNQWSSAKTRYRSIALLNTTALSLT